VGRGFSLTTIANRIDALRKLFAEFLFRVSHWWWVKVHPLERFRYTHSSWTFPVI
jgi:hypothetical protein